MVATENTDRKLHPSPYTSVCKLLDKSVGVRCCTGNPSNFSSKEDVEYMFHGSEHTIVAYAMI